MQCDFNYNSYIYRIMKYCGRQDIALAFLSLYHSDCRGLITPIHGHSICNPELALEDRTVKLGLLASRLCKLRKVFGYLDILLLHGELLTFAYNKDLTIYCHTHGRLKWYLMFDASLGMPEINSKQKRFPSGYMNRKNLIIASTGNYITGSFCY